MRRGPGGFCLLVFLACLVAGVPGLAAQTASSAVPSGDVYRIVEKHNYRKKTGGAYVGAVYREIRGVLHRSGAPGGEGAPYDGRFFVLEETKRTGLESAPRVEASYPMKLLVGSAGAVRGGKGERFPTLRDFPSLPKDGLAPGMKWQAFAERVLDPDFSGKVTPVKVLVEYRYDGRGTYKGFEGDKITAKYAVRYRKDRESGGDPDLLEVTGTHDVSIFLPAEAGGPRLYTETFKETYRYEAGRQTSLEGTVLTFFEGVTPLDRPRLLEELKTRLVEAKPGPEAKPVPDKPASSARPLAADLPAEGRNLPDIDVSERPEGLALTVNNLKFKPDQAELLPAEAGRLELLSRALAKIPGRTFLVVGHTADLGKPEGQKVLSVDRAKAIVDALVKRGIPASRLAFQGRGAEEPVAENATEEGRAKNRRVEIIILED